MSSVDLKLGDLVSVWDLQDLLLRDFQWLVRHRLVVLRQSRRGWVWQIRV